MTTTSHLKAPAGMPPLPQKGAGARGGRRWRRRDGADHARAQRRRRLSCKSPRPWAGSCRSTHGPTAISRARCVSTVPRRRGTVD